MITTMSNKDSSARMTGTFIIFILNLFLVVIREKRDLSQPSDSYIILIMNSQSRTLAAPAPASLALRGPCQGLKVDMRIALRRRGGPSVLASSINIVHALFVYFLLIVAIICTIYRSTNFIYYWEICIFAPIIAKYLFRMVILFYPATSARVHFTKCDHCATAASFRRWLAPVVGAFLTVAYRRWSTSWDRFS